MYYYFVVGVIARDMGNVVANMEISLAGPIESYATVKEIERNLAEQFGVPTFTVTFYALLRKED
ncbi:MAG TPA: hypothetical protein VNO70_11775 [Blastocatellia bacterium]|nr:hypothetical protein [Blastocatellia bacterium]